MATPTVRQLAVSNIAIYKPLPNVSAQDKRLLHELYATNVFNDQVMKERLPSQAYKHVRQLIDSGTAYTLQPEMADIVANAMKEWALSKSATHYTHWFQPLTGSTAEKHDSFLKLDKDRALVEFSGEVLVRGEPDASSFPSGGLRSTFEARGYTVWDPSSPTFIKNGVLVIPTAFCSWTGEALDKKTPLLRSCKAISDQVLRVLKLLDDKAISVRTYLGPEQEFFLVDSTLAIHRPDLVACERTLLGKAPALDQHASFHYFGALHQRILACLQETEYELWKLGVPVKTRHNEVAPAQYEMAPIYEAVTTATDHNLLLMDVLQTVAQKHNFTAIFYEKPFRGVNGSGKHNNWSIGTNIKNLFEPGPDPASNTTFMLFLAATIRAIDEHDDLLRYSIVTPGNDHRLGAHEAPPAIMSVYLGESLDQACRKVMSNDRKNNDNDIKAETLDHGLESLPVVGRDATDRNRTSPFAFTGNKFEFRAVGSSQTCARPNFILNTIVADSLRSMANEIEALIKKNVSKEAAIRQVIGDSLRKHYRVVFDGDGYSKAWVEEAQKRGLHNWKTTPDVLINLATESNIQLFESLKVLTKTEYLSHYQIAYELFNSSKKIEASCLYNMISTKIVPAALKYQKIVGDSLTSLKQAAPTLSSDAIVNQQKLFEQVVTLTNQLLGVNKKLGQQIAELEKLLHDEDNLHKAALYARDYVNETMEQIRVIADELETIVDDELWPLPKYDELLHLL